MEKKVRKNKLTGWSVRGRPFSPKEYNRSHLKASSKQNYSGYLVEFARQYKKNKLRYLL